MQVTRSKENNFNLLRLFAAFQIAVYHSYEHLHIPSPFINNLIYATRYFPGLQVLFIISGFLVFASFERNDSLKIYFRNRFLRIFPGLWLCLLVTIGILAGFGYINHDNIFSAQFWSWVGTQFSFLQFYTPEMLRDFGVGNPNGALWTIPVELSFYIFIPILFWLFRKTRISMNIWILQWIIISVAFNILYQPYKFSAERSEFVKVTGVTLLPYLFYFLLGAITYYNWEKIRTWYEGKGVVWLAVYLLYCLLFCTWLHKFQFGYWTNFYHFISAVLLSQAVISLSFTTKWMGNKVLRNNDFSYGIYIYHMPVINVLIEFGYRSGNYAFILVLVCVATLSWLSWMYIERPALSLKNKPLT